jgi:hypothetical protein
MTRSPLVTIAGRNGLIGGIALSATLIALYYLGKHPLLIPLMFDLRIFLFTLFIVLAIREFKIYNGGKLHFWQGIAAGMITYMVIAFFTTMVLLLFGSVIQPEFVTDYINVSMDGLLSNKDIWVETLGEERFSAAIENLPSTTMSDLAFDYFLKSTPIGFILTLIISLLLRKTT